MIDLLMAILSSAGLFVLLRSFGPWRVNSFQAIVVNYAVAGCFGLMMSGFQIPPLGADRPEWVLPGFALGFLFIGIFYLMALTAINSGAAIASVATKMSMVLPLLFFGLIWQPTGLQTVEILAAAIGVAGVVLAGFEPGKEPKTLWVILLPIGVFVGSGFVDIGIALFSSPPFLTDADDAALFGSAPFFGALSLGLVTLVYRGIRYRTRPHLPSILAGAALGVVNYGSLYFLVRAIRSEMFSKSLIIPVVNLGVIVVSGLIASFLFKEEIKGRKALGFILCCGALGLMILWRDV